ncbi:MAG: FKBP-type peptidyl-prolyl cis-trans isomerase [Candidatus Protochlamydia sp.]|nr:FKBP-type peptidyl-prolyl cis-trans isomerase [Candidatus Protochlamydia sp.]
MLYKKRFLAGASLGLLLGLCSLQANDMDLKNHEGEKSVQSSDAGEKSDQIDMNKLSEAFGHFIGRNLQSPGLKFDLEGIIKGIREGAAGKPAPLTEKEYEEMMSAVQERAFKEMSSTNLKAANDFMVKNKTAEGITEVVPDKLQYVILKEGTGPVVESHSAPKIHYTGKYQDGTVFGTSEEMGGPITIPLDQTIPGFSKGILGMKEGEKRRLFVHPDLGYGTTGQLPPNELLIFDIDLVKANSEDVKNKGAKSESDDEDEDDIYIDEEDLDEEHSHTNKRVPSATK